MKLSLNSFRGEAPRISPRLLPDTAAQAAVNSRLLTGDLEAWRQFASEKVLSTSAPVETIYKLNGSWLSWGADVDVARGAVAGDTTFRTFITGPDVYDEPRFTNYALATTGSEPFPVATRPLGVPGPDSAPTLTVGVDPTATTFAIDITDAGDELATSWITSPVVSAGTFNSSVTQSATEGNPSPSYELAWRDFGDQPNQGTYLYRNFGIGSALAVKMTFDWKVDEISNASKLWAGVMRDSSGVGISVQVDQTPAGWALSIGTGSSWAQGQFQSTLVSKSVTGLAANTWLRMVVDLVVNDGGTTTVTATLRDTSDTDIDSLSTTVSTISSGDYCGFGSGFDQLGSISHAWVDNIHVQASGSTNYVPTQIATSYVFTYVNDLDQMSAPGPASATILRPDGVSVTVTTPTTVPSGYDSEYGVNRKRIYRAVTGATGTAFKFVAEIALGTADYIDVLDDSELGEVLISDLFALPPADMRGILALPNGVTAGFSKNQLCLSAKNYPHAWPVEYRLTVDTDIVAIGNIDTTVVIGTENFVYLAIGSDPAAYSMTKLEVPQACVAKRSLAYLTGIGVVFASPDGLIAVSGAGQIRNLTSSVFTREQWQALTPTSMRGVAHDDIYWLFSDGGSYALDMKSDGFGLIELGFHASAAFADPLTDKLFLVLDDNDEPTDELLPIASTAVTPDGQTIYEFNAGAGDGKMVQRWKGKLYLLPNPTAFFVCQVKAEDYTNLVVRLSANGSVLFEAAIASEEPFTLPMANQYTRAEIEVVGTSRVRSIEFAEDIAELA